MPSFSYDTPRPTLDLTQVNETTRRALYDAVVEVHFSPGPEEVRAAREDPDNRWVPDYGPDAAGLTVFHAFGRWLTVWRNREEPAEAPEARRWTVLSIHSDPDGPSGLAFSEV